MLTLCVIYELPATQAAQVLGVPLGTVKSRLSRAKTKLVSADEQSQHPLASSASDSIAERSSR
ncbi:RNA polymerase sigma factor [Glutamicibacter protophormiae]